MTMNINDIIKEEIDRQSSKHQIKPHELKDVLNELFSFNQSKLLKGLGDQNEILDDKDVLPQEFWDELMEVINESYHEDESTWDKELTKRKMQILAYKYFTKQDLEPLDKIEKDLRLEVKKYYSALQNYVSLENFMDRFFNLPSQLLFKFVRYLLNNSKALNQKLKISKSQFKEEIEKLKLERKKIIDKVSFISNKNVTSLNLETIKDLFDAGVFYEDNFLNRGVNEYLYKMLQHKVSSKNIAETYNETLLNDLLSSIEKSKSYLSHIEAIKNEEDTEYFSPYGVQVGRRFDNEIEAIDNDDTEDDGIIDKDSIFKEPNARIKTVSYSWDEGGAEGEGDGGDGDLSGSGGGGGGGSFGGGSYGGPSGGDETIDVDMGNEGGGDAGSGDDMPTDEDGFPEDFGTPESNDTGGDEEEK